MGETAISKSINDAVEQFGGVVVRVQSGMVQVRGGFMHLAKPGTPDRLVLLPHGRSVWLEVKDPDRKKDSKEQIENQRLWRLRAQRLGHLVFQVETVREAIAACQEAMR